LKDPVIVHLFTKATSYPKLPCAFGLSRIVMSTVAMTDLNQQVKARKLPAGFSMAGVTFVLAALSWIGPFSIDTYLPSLPFISKDFHVPTGQVQQTMTAFMLFFAIMSIWHGAISDAYGRRRLTLISLSIFVAASAGCALSPGVHFLMFFRAVQGATAGAGMIVGRAVVRDLFEGPAAQRLMSHVATIFTIAPVVAPVVGGWLQVWFGWRSVFAFMGVLSGFVLVSCLRALPETLPVEKRQRLQPAFLARSYWRVLTKPAFLMACGSMAFISAGFFIYILSAPIFLMKHLHLGATQFLWLFLPNSAAMVIGAWISGRCAGRISGNQTIFAGYAVMTIAAIGNVLLNLLLPPMLPWSILPIFIYVIGMSIATPSLTLLTLDLFPTQRGLTASCQGFISLGANSIVSAFVALVWGTPLSLACTELTLLGLGVVTLLVYLKAMKRQNLVDGSQ
jgi:DHA1 family bicyclomycin/chloramphenicol resistance-like MFS transporter